MPESTAFGAATAQPVLADAFTRPKRLKFGWISV